MNDKFPDRSARTTLAAPAKPRPEQKAKAAAAELAAAKKREDDERRAKAAEAEQQAKAAEAERKAAEAKQKAEEAARNKAAAEAATLRAASEQQAREAEAARKAAELASAQEAACKKEQSKLEELAAKGSEGSGVDDLKAFARTVTCDRLGSLVVATLEKFNADAAKRAAALPNSPELVRLGSGRAGANWMHDRQNRWHAWRADQDCARALYGDRGPAVRLDKRDRGAGRRIDQAYDPRLPA